MRGRMYDQHHQAPFSTHTISPLYKYASSQSYKHHPQHTILSSLHTHTHYLHHTSTILHHTGTILTLQAPHSTSTILTIQPPSSSYVQAPYTYPLLICCIILLYISLNITRYSSSPKTIYDCNRYNIRNMSVVQSATFH